MSYAFAPSAFPAPAAPPFYSSAERAQAMRTIFGPNWSGRDPRADYFASLDTGVPMCATRALRILLDIAPADPADIWAAFEKSYLIRQYMLFGGYHISTDWPNKQITVNIRRAGCPAAVINTAAWASHNVRLQIDRLGSSIAVVEEMAVELSNARGAPRTAVYGRLCREVGGLVAAGWVGYAAALRVLKAAGRKCRLFDDMGSAFETQFRDAVYAEMDTRRQGWSGVLKLLA